MSHHGVRTSRTERGTVLLDFTCVRNDEESGPCSSDSENEQQHDDDDDIVVVVRVVPASRGGGDAHHAARAVHRARAHAPAITARRLMLDDRSHLLESLRLAQLTFQRAQGRIACLTPHKDTLKLLVGGGSPYVHGSDDNRMWESRIKKARTEEDMLDLYRLLLTYFTVNDL